MFGHYNDYDFMYVIDMNTHFLLFFNYYIVVTFAHFWIAIRFKKPIDWRFIWNSVIVIVFPSEKHIKSRGKSDILEILLLWFDFLYFVVKLLWDGFTYTNFTEFIFIIVFSDYKYLIMSRIEIKKTLICYLKADFTVWKIWRGRFEKPAFCIRVVEYWGEALF